jgi:hypothetical protein
MPGNYGENWLRVIKNEPGTVQGGGKGSGGLRLHLEAHTAER